MNKMTFKQELSFKAYDNISMRDIEKEINYIKKQMEKCAYNRVYEISIIKAKKKISIIKHSFGRTQLVIPQNIDPEIYRQIFVDKFKELGFEDSDILLSTIALGECVYYDIDLHW